jgi:hypothetical protein
VLNVQRPDADQAAIPGYERGAAPERVGRRGEDRVIEHILPVTGEFLTGNDRRCYRVTPPALGRHDDAVAGADPRFGAKLRRRHRKSPERLDQTESGLLVIGQHMPRDSPANARCEPDRLGLSDQITDRQDQAVLADQDAAAGPLSTQCPGRKSVLRDSGMKPQHGPERPVQVKGIIFRLWLKFGRYFPLDRSRHRRGSSVLISYDNAATVRRYPALVKKLGGRQDPQALSVPSAPAGTPIA